MTDETPTSDQRRLYVAHVVIEFDFAFAAGPEEAQAGEVACNLINRAADDLSSLYDYAMVKVNLAAPAYEMPMGACDDDAVYNLRTVDGRSVKWRDAVENDKLLHAAAGAPPASGLPAAAERFSVSQPDCQSCGATPEEPHGSECGDVDNDADGEPAPEAPSEDVVRLDYSELPPSYRLHEGEDCDGEPPDAAGVGGCLATKYWSTWFWVLDSEDDAGLTRRDKSIAIADAWAHHKAHNDPPGMQVWQTNLRQVLVVASSLSTCASCDLHCGHSRGARSATWRWAVCSTTSGRAS